MNAFSIKKCKHCGSTDLSWGVNMSNCGSAVDGRLRMHEIEVHYYLGCNYCSETLGYAPEGLVLEILNNHTRRSVE